MSSTVAPVPAVTGAAAPARPPARAGRRSVLRLHRITTAVLLVGLVVTVLLTVASRVNYLGSERRLINAQTRLAADALAVAPVDLQRRLGRPVSLAAATGDVEQFRSGIADSMHAKPFTTSVLLRLAGATPQALTTVGPAPLLAPGSPQVAQLCRRAVATQGLAVDFLNSGRQPRMAYAFYAGNTHGRYVGYAEQLLPASRRAPTPANSPLGDAAFALYFGPSATSSMLIESNTGRLPLRGTRATTTFAFGDRELTLTVAPRHSLLGGFAQSVAWAIALVGSVFTLVTAVLVERLVRRRSVAEELASVTDQLYRAEHSVAETLQRSLLPQQLPRLASLDVAVRYLPGTAGIDVGGDWYDVVALDARTVMFTVGDVSGRGLEAATVMARLRHAISAYALDGDDPATVLEKVNRLLDVVRDGRFATVLCGHLDLTTGVARVASAGHFAPLVVDASGSTIVDVAAGPPVGVVPGRRYATTEIALRAGAGLLAFTDGLVERRGEPVTEGIARLAAVARMQDGLEATLDEIVGELAVGGAGDDVAVLAMRWGR